MKIKFEMLKKFDSIEIYKNIEEFYKMIFECMIDVNIDNVNDCFQLSCDMSHMYDSYEHMKNILKNKKIENCFVIYDAENNNVYLCDINDDINMYCVCYNCLFENDFDIECVDKYEKQYIIYLLFTRFMFDIDK